MLVRAIKSVGVSILKLAGWCTRLASGEWILTTLHRDNGGGVVATRAFLVSVVLYAIAIGGRDAIDPERVLRLDLHRLRELVRETLPWFGARSSRHRTRRSTRGSLLSGTTSPHSTTRSSRPSYPSRSTPDNPNEAMAQWKAGFVEDADDLHLATKKMFANAVNVWAEQERVRKSFCQDTTGGQERLEEILVRVRAAIADRQRTYTRK